MFNKQVSNLWIDPNYIAGGNSDLALLQLYTPFTTTPYVKGISLPQANYNFNNATCQLIGHGFNASGSNL